MIPTDLGLGTTLAENGDTNRLESPPTSTGFLIEVDDESYSCANSSRECIGTASMDSQISGRVKHWVTKKIKLHPEDDTKKKEQEAEREQELSKKESKHVLRLRLLVLTALVTLAVSVSVVVYMFIAHSEMNEFESQYEGASGKVIETFEEILNRLGSVSSLGISLTAYGMDHKEKTDWPFITLSSFAQKANHARQVSGALMVSMAHLVTKDNFDAWNQFSQLTVEQNWM